MSTSFVYRARTIEKSIYKRRRGRFAEQYLSEGGFEGGVDSEMKRIHLALIDSSLNGQFTLQLFCDCAQKKGNTGKYATARIGYSRAM
jgi:hypothetical protein